MNQWPVDVLAGRECIGAGFEWTRKKGDSTSLFDERCAADRGRIGGQQLQSEGMAGMGRSGGLRRRKEQRSRDGQTGSRARQSPTLPGKAIHLTYIRYTRTVWADVCQMVRGVRCLSGDCSGGDPPEKYFST